MAGLRKLHKSFRQKIGIHQSKPVKRKNKPETVQCEPVGISNQDQSEVMFEERKTLDLGASDTVEQDFTCILTSTQLRSGLLAQMPRPDVSPIACVDSISSD